MVHLPLKRMERLAELGDLSLTELAKLCGRGHATLTNALSRNSHLTLETLHRLAALAPDESSRGRWYAWLAGASETEPTGDEVRRAVESVRARVTQSSAAVVQS